MLSERGQASGDRRRCVWPMREMPEPLSPTRNPFTSLPRHSFPVMARHSFPVMARLVRAIRHRTGLNRMALPRTSRGGPWIISSGICHSENSHFRSEIRHDSQKDSTKDRRRMCSPASPLDPRRMRNCLQPASPIRPRARSGSPMVQIPSPAAMKYHNSLRVITRSYTSRAPINFTARWSSEFNVNCV
jgi:hypothetical protein